MAPAISSKLNRVIRSGVVPTTTAPQTGHVMRPQVDPAVTDAQDTTDLDRIFAALSQSSLNQEPPISEPALTLDDGRTNVRGVLGGEPGAIAPSQSSAAPRARRRFGVGSPADTPGTEEGGNRSKELPAQQDAWDERISARLSKGAGAAAEPARPEVSEQQDASSSLPIRQRRRFGVESVSAQAPVETKAGAGTSRPWAHLESDSDRVQVVNARKSMSAAKVLAPLVAAVSFRPGSAANSKGRSAALAELLVGVHQNATQTAEGISQALREDVPSWMVTQLMQSYAGIMARRWERVGCVDPNALGQAMAELLGSDSGQIAALIQGASEDAYVEVTGPDVARYRIAVSVTNAAWSLFDWVTHERLSVTPGGDMPSEFFTYGLEVSEIVNRLLVRCVDECRALVIQNDSADLRTAHMQSSIHRMSQLVGAEYVTQTRQIMDWIGEEGLSDQEFSARLTSAAAELDSRILPHIFEWARVNFLRIEQGAFKAIEQLGERAALNRDQQQGGM